MRAVRLLLLLASFLLINTAHAASDGRACGGRTVSGGAVCCLSGTVTLQGKPVEGALVTVALAKSKLTLNDLTAYVDGDLVPTYGFSLHDSPLAVQPGDLLVITISYGDLKREFEQVVQEGEQWLEIALDGETVLVRAQAAVLLKERSYDVSDPQ